MHQQIHRAVEELPALGHPPGDAGETVAVLLGEELQVSTAQRTDLARGDAAQDESRLGVADAEGGEAFEILDGGGTEFLDQNLAVMTQFRDEVRGSRGSAGHRPRKPGENRPPRAADRLRPAANSWPP